MVFKNKKGFAVSEMLTGLVIVLVLGIIAVAGYTAFKDLNTDIQADPDINNVSKNMTAETFADYPGTMDGMFITFVVFFWILLIVASWYAQSHPLFLVLMILFLIAVFVVAGLLSNTWDELSGETDFQAGTSSLPMTNWLLDNYLLFFVVAGFSSLTAMFIRSRSGL